MAITETAPLLLTPGRRCQNGKPVPVERADWKQYVKELGEVGKLAHNTSKTRSHEAFVDVSEKLNDACANCHKVYRDKGETALRLWKTIASVLRRLNRRLRFFSPHEHGRSYCAPQVKQSKNAS